MITLLNKFDDHYIIKEQDIIDIAYSYIKANNLEGYLSDIYIDNNSNHLGHYNIRTKEIVLNDEKVIKFGYRLYDKLHDKYQIDEDNYTYFLNFYYMYIIYHELTHVSQRAKYEMNLGKEINIFNYMYELCSKLHRDDIIFYKTNHNLFPMEIDANNNGYLIAYNLMKYTKLPSKETKIMYEQYLFSLTCYYDKLMNSTLLPFNKSLKEKDDTYKIISPIEKLSRVSDNISLYEIFDIVRQINLSKLERLNLGLPIEVNEYDGLEKERKKILIKNNNF